jgi:dihydrodipicolinate synthase/N-acetylneuraminate lyase
VVQDKRQKRYPRTIMATACIPWKEDYSFDETTFKEFMQKLKESDLTYIYLFGTAGEGYAVSDSQFQKIVQVFAEEMKEPALHPIVGLISLSLPVMKERLDIAYQYGIRDFMVALPSWGRVSWPELIRFFDELCTPYPDCSFIHYNNPRSKRMIEIPEYAVLAEKFPNLAAVKYSTTDLTIIRDMMETSSPLQYFITEPGFGYGSLIGETGLLLSISSINMRKAWEYFHAASRKDWQAILQHQEEIHGLTKALINAVGSGRIDGAYDKVFCKMLHSDYPLRLLPPYKGAEQGEFDEFLESVKSGYPQWLEQI